MTKNQRQSDDVHDTLTLFMLVHLALASDADAELTKHQLTRTHHRILYLVTHGPGVSVGRIVEVLRLTPQAVQGPMRRLLDDGYIEQRASNEDRRRRHLHATRKGEILLRTVSEKQFDRIARAFSKASTSAIYQFSSMLLRLADPEDLIWTLGLGAVVDEAEAALPPPQRRTRINADTAAETSSKYASSVAKRRSGLRG